MRWLVLLWQGIRWVHANPRWIVYVVGLLAKLTTPRPTEPSIRVLHDALWTWGMLGMLLLLLVETIWWSEQAYHQIALRFAGLALVAWAIAHIGPSLLLIAREFPDLMVPLGIAGILAVLVLMTIPRTHRGEVH